MDLYVYDVKTKAVKLVAMPKLATSTYINGFPSISPDNRHIVFTSTSRDYHVNDNNSREDVVVVNLETDEVRMLSVNDEGVVGNDNSGAATFINNQEVLFATASTNLIQGESAPRGLKYYIKNIETNKIEKVGFDFSQIYSASISSVEPAAIAPSENLMAIRTNTSSSIFEGVSNGETDILLLDFRAISGMVISRNNTGTPSNGGSRRAVISPNGEWVAFISEADNLIPGDTNLADDLFVKHVPTGEVRRVTNRDNGSQVPSGSTIYPIAFSPTSNRLAFWYGASLASMHLTKEIYESNSILTSTPFLIYVFDLESGELVIASRNANGDIVGFAPSLLGFSGLWSSLGITANNQGWAVTFSDD